MICLLQLKLSGWIAHTSLFTLLLVKGMSKLSYLVYPPNICLLLFFFFFNVIGQFLQLGFLQWKARLNG